MLDFSDILRVKVQGLSGEWQISDWRSPWASSACDLVRRNCCAWEALLVRAIIEPHDSKLACD
jgi:hypothetical protein